MKQLLAVGVVAFAAASAFGAEYWYYGPSNVWDDVSCYTKDEAGKTPADEKPGAGDTVYLKGDKDYYINDSTIGFFSTGRISPTSSRRAGSTPAIRVPRLSGCGSATRPARPGSTTCGSTNCR